MVDPWQTRKIGHYFRKKICKKERHFFLYFSIYFSFVRKFSFNGWKGIRFKHLLCYIVCKVDEESDREIVRIAIKGMQFSLANSQTKFVHDYRTTYAFVKRTNTTRQLLFFTFYCSFYEPYCHSRPFYDVVFSFNNEKLRKNFILFAWQYKNAVVFACFRKLRYFIIHWRFIDSILHLILRRASRKQNQVSRVTRKIISWFYRYDKK